MNRLFTSSQKELAGYTSRTEARTLNLYEATMNIVYHYVSLGDDIITANDKVDQISDEILDTLSGAVIGYEMGNSRQKQKLKDGIQAIDEVTYPFFNQVAKDILINKL